MINQCGAHLSVTLTRYALRANKPDASALPPHPSSATSQPPAERRAANPRRAGHPEEACAQSNVLMDTANWTAGRDGVMPRHVLASKQAQVRMLSP